LSNGPPGAIRIITKVIAMMTKSVGTAPTSRFRA
jgi:hypothetical protein